MHRAVVDTAAWIEGLGHPLTPDDGRRRFEGALGGTMDEIVLSDVLAETIGEGLGEAKLLRRLKMLLAIDTSIRCKSVLQHGQYSEIVAGTVRHGDPETIARFCHDAAACARETFVLHWDRSRKGSEFAAALSAFGSDLCSLDGPDNGYLDFGDAFVSKWDMREQLLQAGSILDLLADEPAALTEMRIEALLRRADDSAGYDLFGIDPEVERGAIYDLLLRHHGITLGDVAAAVGGAGRR